VASKAARNFPQSAALLEVKGLAEAMLLLTDDALASYRRALELDPRSSRANLGLATAQRAAGMKPDAATTFERGIREFPRDALHYQEYGLMLLQEAKSGDAAAEVRAVSLLRQALALNPDLSEVQYQLGSLALTKGDLSEAMRHLEHAAKLEPGLSKIHFALARALRRAGQDDRAARSMEMYTKLKAAEEQANPGFPVPSR
jgi:tetratricopeptide (TPR) repeat protein